MAPARFIRRARFTCLTHLLLTGGTTLFALPVNAQSAVEPSYTVPSARPWATIPDDECETGLPGSLAPEPEETLPSHCYTPRDGTLSGGYFAWDVGWLSFKPRPAARAGVGSGVASQMRLAFQLWDHWLVGVGGGVYAPDDERPFSESVVDCSAINGQVIESTCDTDPHSADSTISAFFATAEVGYQHRFRPGVGVSLAPGLSLGYLVSGAPTRSVSCEGCRSETIDLDASGGYLAPFFRITFGQSGYIGVVVRSQWFFFTDVKQMTVIGLEGGLP